MINENVLIERGMLLYGPPGTGKSVLTELLPELIGFTPLSEPLSSSEVKKNKIKLLDILSYIIYY